MMSLTKVQGPDSGAKICSFECSFESSFEYFSNSFVKQVFKGAFKGVFKEATFLHQNRGPGLSKRNGAKIRELS